MIRLLLHKLTTFSGHQDFGRAIHRAPEFSRKYDHSPTLPFQYGIPSECEAREEDTTSGMYEYKDDED
jgi:hypothetical protein